MIISLAINTVMIWEDIGLFLSLLFIIIIKFYLFILFLTWHPDNIAIISFDIYPNYYKRGKL